MKGEINVPLSYLDPNIRGKTKRLSVCFTWILFWGMKCNVCTSVRLETRYEGWNEMLFVSLSVLHGSQNEEWNKTFFRRSILRGFQYKKLKKFIRLSYFDPNMRVKRNVVCPSVLLSKTTICPSAWRRFKYEGWSETLFVCLACLYSNIRGEEKHSLSVCLTWVAVFGEKKRSLSICLS